MRAAVGLPERDGLLVRGVVEGSAGGARRARARRPARRARAAGRSTGVDDLFDALEARRRALTLTVVRGTEERDGRHVTLQL